MDIEPKRRRGRPPKPDAKSPAELARDYRARRKAAGKVVRTLHVDALTDRAMDADEQERFRKALLRVENLEQDRARLERRVSELEAALKAEERAHNVALKEIITLKQASR